MTVQHKKCLICNSQDLRKLFCYENVSLVRCRKCDFVFSSKIPSIDELLLHYNLYPRNIEISKITINRYSELLDSFEKYRHTNNILDIGCGDGHFLEVAKEKGWHVYGTEFTDDALVLCKSKNINVCKGILNGANYSDIKFDVITSFEVIEHINNPIDEIKNINFLLRKGGVFYFTTPNFNSLNRYLLKSKWSVIEYPEHLSYYTSKSMSIFLKRNKFDRVFLKTHGFSFSMSLNKNENAYISNKDRNKNLRESFECSFFMRHLKSFLNKLLNIFRIGESMKGLFIKK